MASSNSFNPSDYEFLLKSLTEGSYVTKAQSLKRFTQLITSDKKQFAIYAKRLVLAIQDLMFEPKEDINLLSSTLALQIINLNPREIQYYIRSKLLKNMVKNLGDAKPPLRKTSHYCLLAYVKTYKSFDELIQIYLSVGINSQEWQLRQKAINSLQSILIMEMKYLNWGSNEFKKTFECLLLKLKDQSPYVQKATEQCLLSLCKMEELRGFSKKLIPQHFQILRNFVQSQFESGNLQQIKLDLEQKKILFPTQKLLQQVRQESVKELSNTGNSLLNLQKIRLAQQNSQKRAIINRIQQIKRNNSSIQTPKIQKQQLSSLRKAQSVMVVTHLKQLKRKGLQKQRVSEIKLEPIKKEAVIQKQESKAQKIENIVSKKVLQDLKNDKDWKVRLEAIEVFQTKFDNNKQAFDIESLNKVYLPILVKLLGDINFKVALISLKIIEQIICMADMNLEMVVPHLVERLSDNKIALRQNISKLIRSQFIRTKDNIWLDHLLSQLKKASNSNTKQQILSILSKLYEDKHCQGYSSQKVIENICPLMEDLKTKIKIKTLDLLVLVTLRASDQQNIKNSLLGRLNQVYYEMYAQKLNKQMKNDKDKQHSVSFSTDQSNPISSSRGNRATSLVNRRYSKNPGNTTSTSLQRDKSSLLDPNDTVRTSSFLDKSKKQAIIRKSEQLQNLNSKISLTNPQVSKTSEKKKSFIKSFRKKTHRVQDFKSTSSSGETYEPFDDPQKQLRNILSQIKSDDWQVSFQALSKTKRIIGCHKDLLVSSVLKSLIPDIVKLIENLRSSLSKNAVVTLNELALQMKKALDPELDLIFNKLIKKSLDTNSFISDEVKKVLVTVCSSTNESKVVSLLMASHTSRAIPIKQVIAHILENVTFLPKFFDKELQKIMTILNNFMSQGSLQIRQKTKTLLSEILSTERGLKLSKLISPEHLLKLKKSVQQRVPQLKIIQKPMLQTEFKQQQRQVPEPRKKQRISQFPQSFGAVEALLEQGQSSDWKIRADSASKLLEIYAAYPDEAAQHRLSSKFVDVLGKQVGDPNVKVATNALRIFKQLTSVVPSLIENNLSVVTNEVFNCFASQKMQVKVMAEEFFDEICNTIETWMLLQHMCNGILYGIQKSKATIIEKLIDVVPSALKAKPNIFQKNVYPMINKVAEEGKPELLGPLKKLVILINEQIGMVCMDYLKPKAKVLMKS